MMPVMSLSVADHPTKTMQKVKAGRNILTDKNQSEQSLSLLENLLPFHR
jgi:hypothetical protein